VDCVDCVVEICGVLIVGGVLSFVELGRRSERVVEVVEFDGGSKWVELTEIVRFLSKRLVWGRLFWLFGGLLFGTFWE